MSLTPNAPEPLDGILARLAAHPVAWLRLAAARYDGSWEVEVCDIITGAPPPSWQAERLMYPDALLISMRTKGATIVRWLKQRWARLAGIKFLFPELNPNPQVQRDAGNAQSFYGTSIWPTIRTDLIFNSASPPNRQQPQQMLVGPAMPTFQNFAMAARYLLRDEPRIDSTIYRRISYRHQDTTARIALVEYSDADVFVTVEGDHLPGITIEIMGMAPGPKKRLTRRPVHPVRLKLAGPTRNAFVVLVQGDRCLDQKNLGWDYPTMQDANVQRIVKFDSSARLKSLIYYKENDQVEFKLGSIGETADEKEAVMKTVVAFANGDGGSLFFGINKRYEAVGLREDVVPQFEDTVSDLIDDWVHPGPAWRFDLLPVPGTRSRIVVELLVAAGEWPPYGVGTTARGLRYYVRHAARSVPARPDEVRGLARSRPAIEPPAGVRLF